MSEIEKMYKNIGIKKEVIPCPAKYYGYGCTRNNWDDENCSCDIEGYPPFTAEKQIEIAKMILFSTWWLNLKRLQFSEKFDEGLAQMINELWQSLTEEEKQQVKGILE